MSRVILEVSLGPLQGTKRVLSPGEKLRVGRRERADLVVPTDELPIDECLARLIRFVEERLQA